MQTAYGAWKFSFNTIERVVKLGLAQMIRFFVVEPIHSGSNPRFDVGVVYVCLIIVSVVDDVAIDNEMLFDQLCEFQDQTHFIFQRCS
jgi:hypothetical protein